MSDTSRALVPVEEPAPTILRQRRSERASEAAGDLLACAKVVLVVAALATVWCILFLFPTLHWYLQLGY